MKKKKKARKYGNVREDCDAALSVYVRLKSAKENGGRAVCVTCGKSLDWKYEAQAGHYIKRGHAAVRFDERNVHVQCKYCNKYLDGNQDEYALFLDRTYGVETRHELMRLKHTERKWLRYELESMTSYYKQAAEAL